MLQEYIKRNICDQEFWFYGGKYILSESHDRVILSDVHLGKANHFRKNGIAVPKEVAKRNITLLQEVLEKHRPRELMILGDLFHSKSNSEWEDFKALRYHYSNIKFHLIIGNHDTFPIYEYIKANIAVDEYYIEDNILYSHEPLAVEYFNFCGHIHPAIRLRGSSLPSLRLPCFFMNDIQLVLPAFGAFTGMKAMKPNKGSQVIAIAENKVFEPQKRGQVTKRSLK